MHTKIKNYLLILAYLLVFTAFCLILNTIKNNFYDFEIKDLSKIVEPINVNVLLDKEIENYNIKTCFDTYCANLYPSYNLKSYNTRFNKKYIVDNLSIQLPPNVSYENINGIYLYTENKGYHYNKHIIKNFKKDYSQETGYTILKLPKIDNYGGKFNHLCIIFLSLFYNAKYFVTPYILLFIGLLIISYIKPPANLNFKVSLILIIVIAATLRLNHITYTSLWLDELYTKYIAIDTFKSTFKDPGNPPLFFILEYIFTKIFSNSDFSLRFLPMTFGILTIPAIWLLFKDVSKNFALFASFMASINTIMIYRSQEARAYSLNMFLTIIAVYILFKCIKNPNTKNIILTGITTIFLANINYYLFLIAIGNILWGIFSLKKNRIKFFTINSIGLLFSVPYFIISLQNALDKDFNSYIGAPSISTVQEIVNYYFLNNTVAIITSSIIIAYFILCLVFKEKNKNKYYPYLFYIFSFTIISATIISFLIKPMLHRINILACYGIFFLLMVSSIYPCFSIKNKIAKYGVLIYSISMTFLFFNITYPYQERIVDNIKNYAEFVYIDAKEYKDKNYDVNVILPSLITNLKEYPNLEKLDFAKFHYINMGTKEVNIKKQDITSKKDPVVIYIPLAGIEFYTDSNNLNSYPVYMGRARSLKLLYE